MGLQKGFRRVHGLRRALTEEERDRIADAIIDHLDLANYRIETKPPRPGQFRDDAGA